MRGMSLLIGVDASRADIPGGAGVARYSRELVSRLIRCEAYSFRLYGRTLVAPLWAHRPNAEWRYVRMPRLWSLVGLSAELAWRPPDALFVPAHVIPPVHPRSVVVTVHDLGYLRFPREHPPLQRLYLRISTRWNVQVARVVLADSQCTKSDLVQLLGVHADKVVLAYPGASPSFRPALEPERTAIRQRYRLPERYFLFVGTLQPRKNLLRLLDAHDLAATGVPLVVVGKPGWMCKPILARIEQSAPNVLHVGPVPDADLPALLSGAVALVIPSLYEGFGLPALEAMACGTPVVASATSSLPEVVGDAGLLVDPTSVDELAAALQALAQDRDLARTLSERGLMRAASFTWERCATVALRAIERACSGDDGQ